ncbi:MAG: efflux RND transporter permease subunit [Candidatus Methylomirabilales bacterium]
MKLIEACIKYPVTVLVGVLLAILFGSISLFRLPWQMTPTIDRPQITVSTEYQGAAPLEVEQEVTDRIEEKLNSVESLTEMTSTSFEGDSRIILKFDWGVNKDVARLDVSEKLGIVKDLPPDADESVIRAVNTDEETPIAWVIVKTTRPINEVWEEADDVIEPRLERVPGVATVWMFGGEDREVHVILDPEAMGARQISVAQVRDALLGENRNVKAGKIDEGKRRYVVRTLGQFTDIRQIPNVIIRQDARGIVYLRDIARVRFGYEDKERVVRVWGKPTIGFGVLRRTGTNTLEVMEGIKKELAYLNDLYRGKDIELVQVYDQTDYIYESVGLVTSNLFYGAFLAVAVLLLFLRSPSSIFIIAFAIPISLVATFVVLDALGRTLNIVMLAGLAFAAGMVVDNSIVILENIYRHRQMGKGKVQAAYDAALEVWGAVLASTLTTIFVFVPIIFVKEEAGQLFRDIAIAISTAVALSLIVSLTVVPMLSSRLLTVNRRAHNPTSRRSLWGFFDMLGLERFGATVVRSTVGALDWLRRGVRRRIVVALTIVCAAVSLSYLFMPPIDYLPQGNRNLIFVLIRTTPGLNIGQREAILKEFERRFALPEIHRMFAVARVENTIMGAIVKPAYHTLPGMRRVITEMRRRAKGVPGTEGVFITQSPLFRRRGAFIGGTNLEVEVKGDSLKQIRTISERLQGDLRRLPQINFVNTSFEAGNPELQIRVDRAKASQLGLSAREVGYVVETMVHGTQAGEFRERGKDLDLVLKGALQDIRRTQDLDQIVFFTPAGRLVKLSDVAAVRFDTGPTKVDHIDRDRAIKLTVNVKGAVPLEKAIQLVEQVVNPVRRALPLGTTIDVAGQARDLSVAWNSIKWSFLLALVVIYLLMCSLFESWSYPLIIMFTVPLAATGGVLAVRLANALEPAIKMDVITMLGFVILAGIVVNNAILIVHQALNHMREGWHPQEAILESVRTRIRPIFMTTATTVFGMLPLVFARGSGSELYRGLGAAVLGGLVVASVFTLILIPTLFSLWVDAKAVLRARLGGRVTEEVAGRHVIPPVGREAEERP